MKRLGASALSLSLAVATAFSMMPETTYASSTNKAGVKYVYKDDDPSTKIRTGIEAVNLNDVTYYDVEQGRGELSAEDGNQINFYKKILTGEAADDEKNDSYAGKSNILNQWAEVAEAVFKDNAYYSAENYAGDTFDESFGERWGEAGYTDISKALSAVSKEDIDAGTDGEERWDYTVVSGLNYADSLKTVRQKSALQIKNMIKNNALWEDYNDNENIFFDKTAGDNTMKSLNDDTKQDVLYTMVTCVDDEGATYAYHYNTFVLAFYDFKLVPLAGEGLEYITSAEGYESIKDASNREAPGVSYTSTVNDDPKVLYDYNKSQTSNNVSLSLPAHTAVALESSGGKTDVTLDYKLPVAVTYKVAIASMGGEVYADRWAICSFSTAGYTQKTFSTSFGVGEDESDDSNLASRGGLTARTNLYNRTIANVDTAGFEESYGNTYGYRNRHAGDDKTINTLDWNSILDGEITLEDDSVPYSVIYKEVDTTGKETGRVITQIDKTGAYGYDYSNKPEGSTYKTSYQVSDEETGKEETVDVTYSLYKGAVTDESGNAVDNTFDDKTNNIKNITLTDKESNQVVFYWVDESAVAPSEVTDGITDSPATASAGDTASEETPKTTLTGSKSTTNTPLSKDEIKGVVGWLGVHDPLSSTGGTLSYSSEGRTTTVGEITPLYPLKYVTLDNEGTIADMVISESGSKSYVGSYVDANMLMDLTLYPGDKFLTKNVSLSSLDTKYVSYYGFKTLLGSWKPVKKDADGNWVVDTSESKVASLKKDSITGNQYVEAGDEEGTYYIQYFINENQYKSLNDTDYASNTEVSRPVIRFNIRKTPFEGKVSLSGTYTGTVGADAVDLDDELNVLITDENGNKIKQDYVWEVAQDKGITLTSDGSVTFQKKGTYQVRIYSDGVYSDWVDVSAKTAADTIQVSGTITSVVGDTAKLDDSLEVTVYDETGKEIVQDHTWDVKELKGISVSEDGEVTATKAGTYHVRAVNADGQYSDWAEITIVDPGITLNKTNVTLTRGASKTLKATVTPAEAQNQTVTWSSDNEKIVSVSETGKITANKTGTAVITAENAYGNTVTCEVKVIKPVSIITLSKSGKAINVSWTKVSGADGYELYATYCDGTYKLQKDVSSSVLSTKLTKMNGKAFTQDAYKMYVKAYKMVGEKKVYLSKTPIAHIQYKTSKTFANATKVTLTGNGTVKTGKSVQLKAAFVIAKNRIQLKHDSAIRYRSTDPSIATVSSTGKVTGKSAGTCYVIAYALDGVSAKLKITVK